MPTLLGLNGPVEDGLGNHEVEHDGDQRRREPGQQRDPKPLAGSERRAQSSFGTGPIS
jgi:hypothetical protein